MKLNCKRRARHQCIYGDISTRSPRNRHFRSCCCVCVCVPLVLEEIGSEKHPRGVCFITALVFRVTRYFWSVGTAVRPGGAFPPSSWVFVPRPLLVLTAVPGIYTFLGVTNQKGSKPSVSYSYCGIFFPRVPPSSKRQRSNQYTPPHRDNAAPTSSLYLPIIVCGCIVRIESNRAPPDTRCSTYSTYYVYRACLFPQDVGVVFVSVFMERAAFEDSSFFLSFFYALVSVLDSVYRTTLSVFIHPQRSSAPRGTTFSRAHQS